MRRKISLYIGDRLADLDDQSIILFNYSMEDLSNPTVVQNSFSQQITLPGTANNNRIFGDIFRQDRLTQYSSSNETGVYFDPTRKTSFTIYNELSEILESGYIKLDRVTTTKGKVEYACTLFGGLGSFLYTLSYGPSGNKLTLAHLDFGQTLDFNITRDVVADAWARIGGDATKSSKYDIINFIPALVGIPPTPFDANKCLVNAVQAGLNYRVDEYHTFHGYTIATLNEKITGNEAKDLRSYLMKPCIKVSAIINAICTYSGYTVNLDPSFFTASNEYWSKTWMTLPMLNDLNINDTETETTQSMSDLETILPIVGGGGSGIYKVTVNAMMFTDMSGVPAGNYKLYVRNAYGIVVNMIVLTITLYDSSQNPISVAVYRATTSGVTVSSAYPQPDILFDHIDSLGQLVDVDGNPVALPLYNEAESAAYYRVDMDMESYSWGSASFNPQNVDGRMWLSGESVVSNNYPFWPILNNSVVRVVGSSTSTVRTGATITQSSLLGGGGTPADYLLSFCKMFGLQIICHKGEKTVDILKRTTFYNGGTVDLTGRIDRSKPINKIPFTFDSRWYKWATKHTGEWADYYSSKYGREFGAMRVNTSYDFNADEKPMTDKIVFKGLCTVLEPSKYFCKLQLDGWDIPSAFLAGGKYALYKGSESKTFDLPLYSDAVKTWDNSTYPMQDTVPRLQVHKEQNGHLDERDTIVFFDGMVDTSADRISLTDDTEAMLYLNANVPCWIPHIYKAIPSWKVDSLPQFTRYIFSGADIIKSLDYGTPAEVLLPGVTYNATSSVYNQYWSKYISDRYDDDSAVVTCTVDLRGMQVGESLFRQFYHFDNAVWALNRIINYSLTTYDLVECEFVRVLNIGNYTS